MDDTETGGVEIEVLADPLLDDPVLIEGLPGVGHVGKLAVEHLLEEKESQLVRRVYSEHFPPQVTIGDTGIASLTCAEFYAIETDDVNLLILTGDHQSQSNEGHYRITNAFLDVADSFGVTRAFALGGVPTGELIDEYTVLGAVTSEPLVEDLEAAGVVFRDNEPAGGIVGVSGLLLGLGGRREFDVACLMGETSGYLVDPKSAHAVLEVLATTVGFDIDYAKLEERADEMEEVVRKIQEMEQGAMDIPSDEDLRYIG